MKISVTGLAFALAIVWSLSILLTGISAMYGYGGLFVEVMASMYKGYTPGVRGALVGAAWAFADGFIGGAALAFIYNKCSGCCRKEKIS